MMDVATKLAAALLLKRGEISLSDIEALPLVDDEQEARRVASQLSEIFDTYRRQSQISGTDGTPDEEVIVLRSTVRPTRARRVSRATR